MMFVLSTVVHRYSFPVQTHYIGSYIGFVFYCTIHRFLYLYSYCGGPNQCSRKYGPNAEHRFCVMHLYNNMVKEYTGRRLRDLLWMAEKVTMITTSTSI